MWGGRSCGSIKPAKTPKVIPLDNQPCQYAEHHCQGVYHCSEIDPTHLDSCEHYEPDENECRELFNAERQINVDETSIVELRAVA